MDKAIKALAKAQQEMATPHKDAVNPHFGNKYASLQSCIDAIKPALHKNGFVLIQAGGKDEFGHFVATEFVHESGERFTSKVYLELDRQNMQGIGSATTYAKRYGLLGLAGMEPDENPDDDDANRASETPKSRAQSPAPQTKRNTDW
jgi:hypothetical protein